MAVNVSRWGTRLKYHVGTKSFGLSCEDAQDEHDWNWLRIKLQPANPGLPGKWPLKPCVHVRVRVCVCVVVIGISSITSLRCLCKIAGIKWQDVITNTDLLHICGTMGIEAFLLEAQL